MTTSEPSQMELFASGSSEPNHEREFWMTPQAGDAEFGETARTSGRPFEMATKLKAQVRAVETGMVNEPRQWGTTGALAPTPRACSGLRSSGANRTELIQWQERTSASTSSPEDTHASHSRSPGSEWARRMTAISGRLLRPSWPPSDPIVAFLRTSLATSRWGSTMCWLTWRRSATPAGRSLYLLRPSAPRTGEIASGFWPTPRAAEAEHPGRVSMEHGGQTGLTEAVNRSVMWPTPRVEPGNFSRVNGKIYETSLQSMARRGLLDVMMPTPTADDARGGGGMTSRMDGRQMNLHTHVKLVPTPDANCWKGSESLEQRRGQLSEARVRMMPTPRHEGFDAGGHRGGTDSLHSAVKATSPGKLSAAWVTRLMMYPDGWLDVDGIPDPLSTDSGTIGKPAVRAPKSTNPSG